MSAARVSSFKALRNLQKPVSSIPAKRSLHITGVNASPRPIEPEQKHSYAPLSLQTLRTECRKRSITYTGTKHELVDRLAEHDGLQARAYSIAMRRIGKEKAEKAARYAQGAGSEWPLTDMARRRPVQEMPSRHFNTSRSLKAVNDSSTIDFAYLPALFDTQLDDSHTEIRVPILPNIDSDEANAILGKHGLDAAAGGFAESEQSTNMKPQIVTVSETLADGAHVEFDMKGHPSAMSDVHDGHPTEMSVDSLTGLAETVGKSAKRMVDKVPEQEGFKAVWNGFLDDLLGEKKSSKLT